jgi:hypothetical protein
LGEVGVDELLQRGEQGAEEVADTAGEDDVVGAVHGVGDADGAGEGAEGSFGEGEDGEEGGELFAVAKAEGGGAEVGFEAAPAAVGADGGGVFEGDVDLAEMAGGFAVDVEGAGIVPDGCADAGAEGEEQEAAGEGPGGVEVVSGGLGVGEE